MCATCRLFVFPFFLQGDDHLNIFAKDNPGANLGSKGTKLYNKHFRAPFMAKGGGKDDSVRRGIVVRLNAKCSQSCIPVCPIHTLGQGKLACEESRTSVAKPTIYEVQVHPMFYPFPTCFVLERGVVICVRYPCGLRVRLFPYPGYKSCWCAYYILV